MEQAGCNHDQDGVEGRRVPVTVRDETLSTVGALTCGDGQGGARG